MYFECSDRVPFIYRVFKRHHSFFILMANYTFLKYIHILLFYYYATGHEYMYLFTIIKVTYFRSRLKIVSVFELNA